MEMEKRAEKGKGRETKIRGYILQRQGPEQVQCEF